MLDDRSVDVLSSRTNENQILLLSNHCVSSCSPIVFFFLVSFKNFLAYSVAFTSPSSCFGHSVIARPLVLASVVTAFSFFPSKCAKHGSIVSVSLISLKSVHLFGR